MEDLNLSLSEVLAVGTPPFPPWTSLVDLDLVRIGKGERSEEEIRERCL